MSTAREEPSVPVESRPLFRDVDTSDEATTQPLNLNEVRDALQNVALAREGSHDDHNTA